MIVSIRHLRESCIVRLTQDSTVVTSSVAAPKVTSNPKASEHCLIDVHLTGIKCSQQSHQYNRVKALEHLIQTLFATVICTKAYPGTLIKIFATVIDPGISQQYTSALCNAVFVGICAKGILANKSICACESEGNMTVMDGRSGQIVLCQWKETERMQEDQEKMLLMGKGYLSRMKEALQRAINLQRG